MNIYKVEDRNPELIDRLVVVWEGSVRATHLFLSDAEILAIKEYVPQALSEVPLLFVAENDEHVPVGFMEHGINEVVVNEQNPQAVGFYEHLGFETVDRSELDEQGNPYPILIMKRR